MYLLSAYIFLLLFLHNQINAQDTLSPGYQRLASIFCYIHDYPTWLEQQKSLQYFLEFAQFLEIDTKRIEDELERYRLQHQCLRAIERLPILIGNG